MGETIYRFGIDELKTIRLKFDNNTVREFPVAIAARYDEALEPEVEQNLRKLAEAIQFFAPKKSPQIEFVLNVRG